MSERDDWTPGYVSPTHQILEEIRRVREASSDQPERDFKPQLERLGRELYRHTGR